MRIVVKDYTDYDEFVTVGTCDMCMGTIRAESGEWTLYDQDTGDYTYIEHEWDWGDFLAAPQCDNIPAFSKWLSSLTEEKLNDFGVYSVRDIDRYELDNLLTEWGGD